MSRDFSFKQFTVKQEAAAFKVGTDSVVLGAWADVAYAEHILDIGTGTGLLALMCAQRNEHALITAIEKDEASAQEAKFTVEQSPWKDRISVEHVALEDFQSPIKFDYIICNPPYFMNALLPPDSRKADARHASENWFGTLAEKVKRLASENAKFGCILPYAEYEYLSTELYNRYWNPVRTQKLWPYPGGEKLRVLAEWKKDHILHIQLPDVYVRNELREYSNAYKNLTRDFYLEF